MERTEILNKLSQIISDVVDDDELVINDDTTASDVNGWDSLAQVLIVGQIQNEFNVKLSSSEVSGLANVGALVDAIKAKM